MLWFLVGLGTGLLIGAAAGLVLSGLLVMAKIGDQAMEKEGSK